MKNTKIDGSISIDRMSGRGVDSLGSQVVKSDYKIVPDCPWSDTLGAQVCKSVIGVIPAERGVWGIYCIADMVWEFFFIYGMVYGLIWNVMIW